MSSILESVTDYMRREDIRRVSTIGLKIGQRSGVVQDALEFAFDALKINTVLEKSKLEIEIIALEGKCKQCGLTFKPENSFLVCPKCDSFADIIAGQELLIDFIEAK